MDKDIILVCKNYVFFMIFLFSTPQLIQHLTELSEKVGGGMKCIGLYKGTTSQTPITVQLSDFNYAPESADDYILLIDTGVQAIAQQTANQAWGMGCRIEEKTTTYFTVHHGQGASGYGIPFSVQIVALK